MLWIIHGHARFWGPLLHSCGHRLVVIARIYGLHPTTDIILQCRRLIAHEPSTLVPTSLSIPPSTKPTRSPICTFTDPRPIRLTEQHPFPYRLTKNPSDHLSASPSHFWTKILPNNPAGVHLEFFMETPSDDLSSHPFARSSKNPSKYSSNAPFLKTHPQNPLPHNQPSPIF